MTRFSLIAIFTLMIGLFSLPVYSEEQDTPSIFEQLSGEWTSSGNAFGAPASSAMTWTQALGSKFYHLNYEIEMRRGPDQTAVFEGVAYYRALEDGSINGFWADNSGDLHPISAIIEGTCLISHWGVEGGKQGRTEYELLASGEMQVTDWIKVGEDWRQFNQNIFARGGDD